MIYFFRTPSGSVIATSADHELSSDEKKELCWLYGEAKEEGKDKLDGYFVGPRREMITPWSTNAVEITQNMNISGIDRIEEYFPVASADADHDPMLQRMYNGLDQEIFTVDIKPAPIMHIENLEEYNEQESNDVYKADMGFCVQAFYHDANIVEDIQCSEDISFQCRNLHKKGIKRTALLKCAKNGRNPQSRRDFLPFFT